MPDARPITSDVDVDLGRLFGSLARNWLRILLAALVVTGLAFVLAGMVTPLYRAETRILIEMRESVYTRPASSGLGEGAAALPDAETIASQVEIIGSSDILREVARRLDLTSHEEFGAAGETSMLGNLMILAGLKSDPTQASVEERMLEALRTGLSIFQVDGSRVIVVRFSSRDPELAASVANAVADAYVAWQAQAERRANADASEWLEPEIENLRGRVREAEARVAEYRAQSGLLIGQNNLALPTQELAEISTELTRARADRSAAEARAAAIRDAMAANRSVETMPEVLASPMVQRLRERQAQIEAEIADLSASLLENHPRMRALRAQGQETARQLRTEISKVLAATENEAATARGREERLVAEVNRLKAASAQAGDSEVELRALEREAMAQRALLESYLTRHREAAARADRSPAPADARIFARATAPAEAYFPKTVPILAAAFAGSLIVMSVLVLMRELFSGRAMRPAPGAVADEEDRPEDMQALPVELEAEPEIGPEIEPVVVATPAAAEDDDGAETELFASEIAGSDEEEDVTMARYQTEEVRPEEITVPEIAGELAGSDVGRAVFISPEGDEATAVSVTVARSLADAGLRTLFLDLTWSGAPSSAMLEEEGRAGITDLLASRAQFADIIHGDLYSGCHVVPAGTVDPVEAMRAADRLPAILEALDDAYDVVVIECGAADAQTIADVTAADSEVLIGALDPRNRTVAGVAADLATLGYGAVLTVTPGARPTRLRRRGSLAA
jgi:uncharacterized protein involved in exopolysaccharide biosynthesis/Mrp family chromosome partitioning ATPase